MSTDNRSSTTLTENLIVAFLGVAIMEIRKLPDPKRRASIARNAAQALKDEANV